MPTRSLVLLLLSLGLVGLAVLGYVDAFELVLLREHLNHPFVFCALACLLAGLAAAGVQLMWLRALAVVYTVMCATAALFAGMTALLFSPIGEAGFVDGPGPYRVRVELTMAGIGPDAVTWLSLREDDGLLSREWPLACFNNDVPDDSFDSITWTGPNSVRIRVGDGRTIPIALHPDSGRPLTTASIDC
ncbi:hypothetical protein [Herbidospora sp. RD11066]